MAIGARSSSNIKTKKGCVKIFTYDKDKDTWEQLGSDLNGLENDGNHLIFGVFRSINKNILSPATVALRSTYDVQIYDWNNEMNLWVETSDGYFSEFTKEMRDVLLHNFVRLSSRLVYQFIS